jgi:hypothetical protein
MKMEENPSASLHENVHEVNGGDEDYVIAGYSLYLFVGQ